jgi:hypothetical protein
MDLTLIKPLIVSTGTPLGVNILTDVPSPTYIFPLLSRKIVYAVEKPMIGVEKGILMPLGLYFKIEVPVVIYTFLLLSSLNSLTPKEVEVEAKYVDIILKLRSNIRILRVVVSRIYIYCVSTYILFALVRYEYTLVRFDIPLRIPNETVTPPAIKMTTA